MRWLPGVLAALLAGSLLAGPPRASFEIIDRDAIPLEGLSSVGRQLIRQSGNYSFARSKRFIARAAGSSDLQTLLDEAEYAYAYQLKILPEPEPPAEPALLVVIRDGEQWQSMTRRHRLREDGLALQVGRELYFKDDASQQRRPDRVFHEMMHLRLREVFGERVPLWLEEGLAGHFGWLSAVEFQGLKDVVIARTQPAASEVDLLSLEDLLTMKRYPRDVERTRAFYRQSEALVSVLAERLGRDGLRRMVVAMSTDGEAEDPLTLFRKACGLEPGGEIAIIAAMRERFFATRL